MNPKSMWLPKYEQIIWELYHRNNHQKYEQWTENEIVFQEMEETIPHHEA